MLNYASADRLFESCLVEAGVVDGWSERLGLSQVKTDAPARHSLLKALRDIQSGADAVLARGKPAEDTLGLSTRDWERRWTAWAASRKAAFYTRAARLLLGEAEYFPYFVNTLRTSHNIVFLSSANDVLQHATGLYLNGPEEELAHPALAAWWEGQHTDGKIVIS